MTCHYSCSTCSSNFYYDLCLTCPATRTLLATTCPCSSGYYEYQQNQCTASTSTSGLDSSLINLSSFAIYAAIGIHYLIIIMTINRVLSIRLKKIVDACQVISLIYYYRFVQTEVASRGLKIMDTFNFNYLTNLICTQNGPPYHCSNFQNLFGVGFSFILFFLLFLVSYFIAYCIYSSQVKQTQVMHIKNGKQVYGTKQNSLGFLTYWQSLTSSLFLLYLDQTAIQTTLSISRIAVINIYGLIIVIPFIIIIILIVRSHFTTINDPKQTTLAYRAKHNYYYYYDEFYHLTYIDHLFTEENINQDKETLKIPFYPQSNLIIIEILFKILLAASTIVFYQYEPYLFTYCCIFILIIYCCMMKIFFTYQLFDLWLYYVLLMIQIFANISFPSSNFFKYFIAFTALGLELLAFIFIVLAILSWRKEKEGQMFKKTFEMLQEKSNKIANLEQSQNQLISNKNEEIQISNIDHSNIEPSLIDSPGRQISIRKISQKKSIPDPSMISQKKQGGTSNMNQSYKPNRQISRKTFSYQNVSNRLTIRNKNSNPQPMETIHEPSKAENTQNIENKTNKLSKNVFTHQIQNLQ